MSRNSQRRKRQSRLRREQRRVNAAAPKHIANLVEADAAPLELQAADESEPKLRKFSMVAYTGGKLNLSGFYLPVVVDLEGLKVSAKSRPILRDHQPSQIVGHTTGIEVTKSIRVSGVISASNEWAREVVESSSNGFPWQASIGASVQQMEMVEKGESVEVNGRKFSGPLYVARKATLGEVSFVALGADDNTSANVAAGKSKEDSAMEFDTYVEALGFDPKSLSDKQRASLQAQFDALDPEEAPEPGGDGSSDETVKAMRIAAAAEQKRIAAIQKHAGKHPDIAATAIAEGWDETKVELEVLRASRPQAPAGHVHTKEVKGDVIEAALCMSARLPNVDKQFKPEVLEAANRDYRHLGVQQLLLTAAVANGYVCGPGTGITRGNIKEVLSYAMPQAIRAAGFSSVSVSGILGNVANKEIAAGYMEEDQTWREIAAVKSVRDFKQVTSYRLLDSMEYEQLGIGGEIKHGKIDEESYTRQARTYAKMFALTREDIINDDLGAFDDLRNRLGRGAAQKFNNLFWTNFMSNLGTTFTSARTNYISGATTNLGTDGVGLGLGVKAFRQMRSPSADGSKRVGGNPALLLVSPELETIADQLYTARNAGPGTSVANTNTFAGKYRPVVCSWLSDSAFTGYSTTMWFLLRKPTDAASMVVSFLNGVETPTVESADSDFNTLGIQFRGYHDFGCDVADYLAGVMSKGAA